MKLCVGVRDPAHLRSLQTQRVNDDPPLCHKTRHMPRRTAEILEGGSLYWVIGGTMLVRQRVTAIEPSVRLDGTACAAIHLNEELVPVMGRPVKAFQGWRYLRSDEAPADLDPGSLEASLPLELAQRLRELCLL